MKTGNAVLSRGETLARSGQASVTETADKNGRLTEERAERSDARGLVPDRFFAELREELFKYFRRRLGDLDLAAEHAQETLLRFAKGGYSAAGADARAIAFGIARNLFTDYLRQLRRKRDLGFHEGNRVDIAALSQIPSGEPTPEEVYIARHDLTVIGAAIETLPPKCRQVFLMHRLQGLKHREIAETLGITASMVEKHIMEATARLIRAVES